jgi:hypothetical protein
VTDDLTKASDTELLHAIRQGSWISLRHLFSKQIEVSRYRFDMIVREARKRNLIGWS